MKIIDYVVVGAGAAGTYVAMELAKKKDKSVFLIEKSYRVGGRLSTKQIEKGISIEAGAARYSNLHVKLVKLIKRLGLTDKKIKISGDTEFIPYRKQYKNIKFTRVEDLMKDLVKKANRLPKKKTIGIYLY